MKHLLVFILCFVGATVTAQIAPNKLFGTWVKIKTTYANGEDLPDDHILKYSYFKYNFASPNNVSASIAYYETGQQNQFELNRNVLDIKSPQGGLMNSLKIESFKDTLVLIQRSADGFSDPYALKYYFVPEGVYQNAIKLKSGDVHSVVDNDTIYKQSPKIYAKYNGQSFQSYMYSGVREAIDMQNRAAHFVATFVISKTGVADSLNVIEGIDEKFTRRFIKVFNKSKKDWKPAVLNGKNVSVLMLVDLGYSTIDTAMPNYFLSKKGDEAYNKEDYESALYYYDQALEKVPTDKDNLLKRGFCRMMLGNKNGACEDWNTIISLGGNNSAETMLKKYCN